MAEWKLKTAEKIRVDLTKQEEDEISRLYHRVYLQVKKKAQAIPKDTKSTSKKMLKELEKQLDEAYKSLGVGLEKELKKQAEKAAKGVVKNATAITKKAGFSIEGAYTHVPKDIVNSIMTGQIYDGKWSLSASIWSQTEKVQSDIKKVIAEGVAGNKSAYAVAKDLEKYVNPSARKEWDWSKVYPGTNKKIDYSAQRLARTMISHAYQQSLERVCAKNPMVDGFIWQAAHSSRVCPICEERNGKFFKKGELPLDHPNGMCTFLASIPPMEEVADRLADWVKGKDDSELDKWYADMGGKLKPNEPEKQLPSYSVPNTSTWIKEMEKQTVAGMLKLEETALSSLYPVEKEGLEAYTGQYYINMNTYLRALAQGMSEEEAKSEGGINSWIDEEMRYALKAMKKLKLDTPLVLRRGTDVGDLAGFLPGNFRDNKEALKLKSVEELKAQFEGMVGEYAGFTSTSSIWSKGFDGNLEIVMYAPKGTHASSIMSISQFGTSEGETLLAPGTKVRILSIEESDGHMNSKIRAYMEIIPQEE